MKYARSRNYKSQRVLPTMLTKLCQRRYMTLFLSLQGWSCELFLYPSTWPISHRHLRKAQVHGRPQKHASADRHHLNRDGIFMGGNNHPLNVIVTGANRGLGFAIAERMVGLGHRVVLACRNPIEVNKSCGSHDTETSLWGMSIRRRDLMPSCRHKECSFLRYQGAVNRSDAPQGRSNHVTALRFFDPS